MSDNIICAKCKELIDGPRYSSPIGMVCEACDDEIWRETFTEEEI